MTGLELSADGTLLAFLYRHVGPDASHLVALFRRAADGITRVYSIGSQSRLRHSTESGYRSR